MLEYSIGHYTKRRQFTTTMIGDISVDDVEYLAEEAAEHHWYEHDGHETRWPSLIRIFLDGVELGSAEVSVEYSPDFTAEAT